MSNTDATTNANANADAAAAAAAAAASKPWHDGVDAETIGHWQNKGWDTKDAKTIALAATKQAREAEKHFGVPPDQLLKMPKADAKPDDWKAFYQRLGAPADPKDYDLSGIKFSDGTELDASFTDALRRALGNAYVPKDKASTIATEMVKYFEDADKNDSAVNAAKIAEEKTKLAANWKTNYDFNHLKAIEGARRLGITPEAVKAMEGQIGYAAVMEAMRKIGVGTSEDTFIERGASGHGNVTTREGAMARKADLMSDLDWAARYLKGGLQEKQEMDAINTMIDGAS